MMMRRSVRLQEAGYYTGGGGPSISYKEILYRVFRRRTSHWRGPHSRNATNEDESVGSYVSIDDYQEDQNAGDISNNSDPQNTSQATQTTTRGTNPTRSTVTTTTTWIRTTRKRTLRRNDVRTSGSFSWNVVSCFFLLLLLAFGIMHYTEMHRQMIDIQQEVQSLRQRLNTVVPLADTMPNFASQSLRARILHHLSSDTYIPQEDAGIFWIKIYNWLFSSVKQQRVIQEHSALRPGQCWPFAGDQGHLFISLSHQVYITHVTLGHITKSQSPSGHITSAPREFSIYGMRSTDEEGTYLGTLVYDEDGEAHQIFELANPDKGVFKYVKLQIENNWGHRENTCLYSFRVHGQLPPPDSTVP